MKRYIFMGVDVENAIYETGPCLRHIGLLQFGFDGGQKKKDLSIT